MAEPPVPPLDIQVFPGAAGEPWRVYAVAAHPKSFLDVYNASGAQTGMTLETLAQVPLGTLVDIEVMFTAAGSYPFEFRGKVGSRRRQREGNLKAGLGVDFQPECGAGVERAVEYALGILEKAKERQSIRQRCQIPVKVSNRGMKTEAVATNISSGGIFLLTPLLNDPGWELELTLKVGLISSITVPAHVVWKRVAAPSGMGMKAVLPPPQQKNIDALVQKLVAQRAKKMS